MSGFPNYNHPYPYQRTVLHTSNAADGMVWNHHNNTSNMLESIPNAYHYGIGSPHPQFGMNHIYGGYSRPPEPTSAVPFASHHSYPPQPPRPQQPTWRPPHLPAVNNSSPSNSNNPRSENSYKVLHYCEPCDKEYSNLTAYQAHCKTHEKCNHPGCAFEGTKKVVVAHFHGTHGLFSGSGYKVIDVEGQKFRVLMGTNPQEIAEWRAERRRKFPTDENIRTKEESHSKFVDAGGLLPKKRKGKLQTNLGKRQRHGLEVENSPRPNRLDADTSGAPTENERAVTLPQSHSHSNSSASVAEVGVFVKPDAEIPLSTPQHSEYPFSSNSLVGMLSGYGSDEDLCGDVDVECALQQASYTGPEIDASSGLGGAPRDVNDNVPVSGHSCGHDSTPPTKITQCIGEDVSVGDSLTHKSEDVSGSGSGRRRTCKYFLKGRCRNGQKCQFLHDVEARKAFCADGDKGDKTKARSTDIPKPLDGGARGTLLRKLLEGEVDTEENLILQCFRFIIRNNFFQHDLMNSSIELNDCSAVVS